MSELYAWPTNDYRYFLAHHGIKGQKHGVRRAEWYPIAAWEAHMARARNPIVEDSIKAGIIKREVNEDKQGRHVPGDRRFIEGRSYINGNMDTAKKLVEKLSGTGTPIIADNGEWQKKERVINDGILGVAVDPNTGKETPTNRATIAYSKTGSHIIPRGKDRKR